MTDATPTTNPGGEVLVYEAPDRELCVEVRLEGETVWLTQRQMAEVFDTSTDNVGLHLKNIYSDSELQSEATTEDFLVVQTEGKRRIQRSIRHYNLDAIISVGYRVNSKQGARFRQWATRTLREHLVRGHTLNERRLAERGPGEAHKDRAPVFLKGDLERTGQRWTLLSPQLKGVLRDDKEDLKHG